MYTFPNSKNILFKAQDDLKSDEEIFNDKEKEINQMKEALDDMQAKVNMANRYLEASYSKEKEQSELMLQMQMQIESLAKQLENAAKSNNEGKQQQQDQHSKAYTNTKGGAGQSPVDLKQRAKTAPNHAASQPNRKLQENEGDSLKPPPLTDKLPGAHSSPAEFSLDRIMQSFRARTQLIVDTLEENDCVQQKDFDTTFDVNTDEIEDAENVETEG